MSELKIYLFEAPVVFFNGDEVELKNLMKYKDVDHVMIKISSKMDDKYIALLNTFIKKLTSKKLTLSQINLDDLVYLFTSELSILKFFPTMKEEDVDYIMGKNYEEYISFDYFLAVKEGKKITRNLSMILNSKLIKSLRVTAYPAIFYNTISENYNISSLEIQGFGKLDFYSLSTGNFQYLVKLKIVDQDSELFKDVFMDRVIKIDSLKKLTLDFNTAHQKIRIKGVYDNYHKIEEKLFEEHIDESQWCMRQTSYMVGSFSNSNIQILEIKGKDVIYEVTTDELFENIEKLENLKELILYKTKFPEQFSLRDKISKRLLILNVSKCGSDTLTHINSYIDGNDVLKELYINGCDVDQRKDFQNINTNIKLKYFGLTNCNCIWGDRKFTENLMPSFIKNNKYMQSVDFTGTIKKYNKILFTSIIQSFSITDAKFGYIKATEDDIEELSELITNHKNANKGVTRFDMIPCIYEGSDEMNEAAYKKLLETYKKIKDIEIKNINFGGDLNINVKKNKFTMGKIEEEDILNMGTVYIYLLKDPILKFDNGSYDYKVIEGLNDLMDYVNCENVVLGIYKNSDLDLIENFMKETKAKEIQFCSHYEEYLMDTEQYITREKNHVKDGNELDKYPKKMFEWIEKNNYVESFMLNDFSYDDLLNLNDLQPVYTQLTKFTLMHPKDEFFIDLSNIDLSNIDPKLEKVIVCKFPKCEQISSVDLRLGRDTDSFLSILNGRISDLGIYMEDDHLMCEYELKNFKNLKVLTISSAILDNSDFEFISTLKQLKTFKFLYGELGDLHSENNLGYYISKMNSLEELDISSLFNFDFNMFEGMKSKLKRIKFECSGQHLNDPYLVQLIKNNLYLEELDLSEIYTAGKQTNYAFYDAVFKHKMLKKVILKSTSLHQNEIEMIINTVEKSKKTAKGIIEFVLDETSIRHLYSKDLLKRLELIQKEYKSLKSNKIEIKNHDFGNDMKTLLEKKKFTFGNMRMESKHKMPQKVNDFEKVEIGDVVLFYSNGKWTTGKVISKPSFKFKNKILKVIMVQGITEFNVKGMKLVDEEFYSFTHDSIRCLMKMENGKWSKDQMKVVDDEKIIEYINK